MATAMYNQMGEYKQAKTPEDEKELRKLGYVNGHEYFSRLNASSEPQTPEPKSRKTRKKAE